MSEPLVPSSLVMHPFSCRLPHVLLFFPSVFAALVTVTVDDTNGGQISYNPSGDWSFGPSCTNCLAHPDASQAFDGTWRDTTYVPSIGTVLTAELSFTGSAVSVYGILGHGPTFSATDLHFFIDNQEVAQYSQTIDNGNNNDFDYNVLLFSTNSLSNSPHTLTIQNGHNGGTQMSLILLDRIVYSYDDGRSSSTSSAQGNQSPTTPPSNPSSQNAASSTSSSSSASLSSTGTSSHGTGSAGTSSKSATSSSPTSPPDSSGLAGNPTDTAVLATTSLPGSDSSSGPSDVVANSDTGKSHTSTIIGIVVGVVIAVILLLLLLCFFLRRRRTDQWLRANSDSSVNVSRPRWASSPGAGSSAVSDGAVMTEVPPSSSVGEAPHLTTLPTTTASRRHRQDTTVEPFDATVAQDETASTRTKYAPRLPPPSSFYSDSYDETSSSHVSSSGSGSAEPRFQRLSAKQSTPEIMSHQSQMVELETAVLLAAENQRLRDENQRLREREQHEVLSTVEEEMPPPYLQVR